MYSCYFCGNSEGLQYVGHLMDSGTSHTRGMAMTIGVGQSIAAPSVFMSTTASNLVQRFAVPKYPGQPTALKILGWWLLATLGWAFAMQFVNHSTFPVFSGPWGAEFIWQLPGAILPGAILSFVIVWVLYKIGIHTHKAKRWNYAMHQLRNSLYCSWCDVAFNNESAGMPEDYVRHLFFNSVSVKLLPLESIR